MLVVPMSRRRRYRTNLGKDGEQYFGLSYAMAKSPAFRSLSGSALKVFIEVRTRSHGGNNGDLSLSMDEAARLLGIGKATAQRAFAELEAKGFLMMMRRGNGSGDWRRPGVPRTRATMESYQRTTGRLGSLGDPRQTCDRRASLRRSRGNRRHSD
jgi:DNA-binding transcriptional MocR family regulator